MILNKNFLANIFIHLKKEKINSGRFHIFCAYGGSGSTFLVKKLGAFARPDVLWQPSFKKRKLYEWRDYSRNNYLLETEEYLTKNVDWSQFNIRTKNVFSKYIKKQDSIEYNLKNFCNWIEKTNYTVLFGNAAVVNFFSRNNFKKVTYLIRHPLHSYISFSKDIRHGKQMKYFGEINSKKSIEFWADRWNRITQDFLNSLNNNNDPILIRFEFVKEDSNVTEFHKKLFEGFDPNKRNEKILSPSSEEYLKSLVADNFYKIYDNWDI